MQLLIGDDHVTTPAFQAPDMIGADHPEEHSWQCFSLLSYSALFLPQT